MNLITYNMDVEVYDLEKRERIVFYGKGNMGSVLFLDDIKELYLNISFEDNSDINDILELYSCNLIINTGMNCVILIH